MKNKLWIQKATRHRGALRRSLGISEDAKIPQKKLKDAEKCHGKIGREARLALTLEKMHPSQKE